MQARAGQLGQATMQELEVESMYPVPSLATGSQSDNLGRQPNLESGKWKVESRTRDSLILPRRFAATHRGVSQYASIDPSSKVEVPD